MIRPRRRRRGLGAGVLLAGLYVAVLVATSATTGRVGPLFDGVGANTPYQWVNPPWYIGANNVKPGPSHTDITFENGVSPLIGVNSGDAQMILNLPQGALPAGPAGETVVRAAFTPLDPKKLAKPASGMRPDGNAYRVEMTYQPSGQPVRQTTTSGNVVMVVPDEADKMLFSLDGKEWTELPTHALGDPNTVGSAFNKPGYYLVGTTLPEFVNPNKGNTKKRVAGIALLVAALALLIGIVVPAILRRSREAQRAEAARAARRTVKRRR